MKAVADQTETYRDLLLKLARRGRLSGAESDALCNAAFKIGRTDRIEKDLSGVRRTLEVYAQHEVDVAAAERERRIKKLSDSVERQTTARREVEKSLWEITRQRDRLLADLRDTKQLLRATETAKNNAQQDARAAVREVEKMRDVAAELRASVEGQRAVLNKTDAQVEELLLERSRLAEALTEARERILRKDGRCASLEAQAVNRERHLRRRKASMKKMIRYMRGQRLLLSRRVQELTCANARLTDEKTVMLRTIDRLRDTDRRLEQTLEQSRKIFANVGSVLSEAGAKFVRDALQAELLRTDNASRTPAVVILSAAL